MTSRGLIIAAPASGCGKTTVALGLARALRQRGLLVQTFKSGPDYIDPAFLSAAAGRECFNLDSWAMPAGQIAALANTAETADLALAEGSMGLFDGVALRGAAGSGATADIAALLGWPVVLVLDASGQAQTAAAVAQGLACFRPAVQVAGVVLNRVASARHERLLRAGMAEAGMTVFGALPRSADVTVPERHLGLVQAGELPQLEALLEDVARLISLYCDLDAMLAAAAAKPGRDAAVTPVSPPGQRIALAQDAAFSFCYAHLLAGWRAAGAEILPFSPLRDEQPPAAADVCWLPGGYPELHAGVLANNSSFLDGLRRFSLSRPVHGECGGYMVLGEAIIDTAGTRHTMAGLLGLITSFERRSMHLGYRRATLAAPMPGHAAGVVLAGHEFHYAGIVAQPDAPLATVVDAMGDAVAETGSRRALVSGSFFHFIAQA